MMNAKLSRMMVHSLGSIVPAVAAGWAEKAFMTPPRPKPLAGEELEILNSAHKSFLEYDDRRIAVYSWGDGPTVLLVHGWGSRAGRMTSLVKPLLAQGYSVVAFDAPAHGDSDGHQTSFVDVAGCLTTVDAWCGHAQFAIGHSMGGASLLVALSGGNLKVQKAIVIGAPSEVKGISLNFAYETGLPEDARSLMQKQMETRFGITWDSLSAQQLGQNVDIPVLVCHDVDDREVGWHHGAAIASSLSNGSLFKTKGLGHRRIIRDSAVIARCLDYLKI